MWLHIVAYICIGYVLGIISFMTLIVLVADKQNKQREKNDEIREWENSRSNGDRID